MGGYEKMIRDFGYAVADTTLFSNSTDGIPNKDYLNLVRGVKSDYPWPGNIEKS